MALTISSALVQCPNLTSSLKHCRLKGPASRFSSSYIRFNRKIPLNGRIICAAASSAGGSSSGSDLNPYEVLGVSPIQGFDMVKTAYSRKKKDAERRGDEATAAQLEKAYDQLMMAQLSDRKKGVTYGSFKVSKDIKYADKQPIVPWGPRFTKSDVKDMRINIAISAVFLGFLSSVMPNGNHCNFYLLYSFIEFLRS